MNGSWEYGVRYDLKPRLASVDGKTKPYLLNGKPSGYINWGWQLGEEGSLSWARKCVADSETPEDMKRTIVRRQVGPVEVFE